MFDYFMIQAYICRHNLIKYTKMMISLRKINTLHKYSVGGKFVSCGGVRDSSYGLDSFLVNLGSCSIVMAESWAFIKPSS